MTCIGIGPKEFLLYVAFGVGAHLFLTWTRQLLWMHTRGKWLILELLEERGPSLGYVLADESNGRLSRSAIYVLLSGLEDEGHISSSDIRNEAGALTLRRIYKITEAGRTALGERP